jgi:hypothetical protein
MLPDAKTMTTIRKSINPAKYTRDKLHELMEYEKRTRAQIDNKVTPVGVVRGDVIATFSTSGGIGNQLQVPIKINFKEFRFLKPPNVVTGCSIVLPIGSVGRPSVADAIRLFDPVTDNAIPCGAMHYYFIQDDLGLYVGSLIIAYAIGDVPEGFQTQVHYEYVGTAIRA